MKEIWKDIINYENLYQVSNFGRVKSLKRTQFCERNKSVSTIKEKILSLGITSSGYYAVSLSKDGIKTTIRVHILVAMSFLNHIPNGRKCVINHKDFNKLNNYVDNLEITTQRQNTNRKHLKSSSLFTGVSWHKGHKKWQSHIRVDGKLKYLGTFSNELEASQAYDTSLNSL